MRKTFNSTLKARTATAFLDAVKHEIRKYIKRERRRDLPEGADFWDFDCRFGRTKEDAAVAHLSALTGLINSAWRPRVAPSSMWKFWPNPAAHATARRAGAAGRGR